MSYKAILRQRAKKNSSVKMLKSFTPYDVIKRPVNSEKAVNDSSHKNAYHFIVAMQASKIDIKEAIKLIYDVEPLKVTTSILPDKGRMNRKLIRKSYKKAVITLKDGESITFGE